MSQYACTFTDMRAHGSPVACRVVEGERMQENPPLCLFR